MPMSAVMLALVAEVLPKGLEDSELFSFVDELSLYYCF